MDPRDRLRARLVGSSCAARAASTLLDQTRSRIDGDRSADRRRSGPDR